MKLQKRNTTVCSAPAQHRKAVYSRSMMRLPLAMCIVLGSGAIVGIPAEARAAEQATEPTQEGVQPAEEASDRRSDGEQVIIVTAQKREERLHSIPIAISAFSGENLDRAGVTGISDLNQLAPSLQFGQAGVDTFVSIRGIGAELTNINAETGVTITQDGVPFSNQFMFDANFFDVERIEVLRGPQGTISGRNATGGAINIYSRRPTRVVEGAVNVTAGNYDRFGVEGHLSGPIVDGAILGRLSFRAERADGWLTNTFRDERQNGADKVQVRASILTDFGDNVEAHLILEGTIDRSPIVSGVDLGRARLDEPGLAESRGVPGFDPDRLEYQADFPNTRRVENYKSILRVAWDLGPTTSLVSTTGYVDYRQQRSDDFDATIVEASSFDLIDVSAWQFSQELTLAADISEKLDMIMGALYLRADAKQVQLFGLPLLGLPLRSFLLEPEQDLNSYSGYAQFRYRMAANFRISAGVRYTHDSKVMSADRSIFGVSAPNITKTGSWDAVTPRVALDFTPSDDLTIFASVSRGFKSGGYTSIASPVEYEPEFVWSYEAGVKAYWFDRRLRTAATAFYMDYTDLQQSLLLRPPGGGVSQFRVENANSATIKGFELEIDARITDRFKLAVSGTWLDATYDELISADQIFPELGERNLAGNRLVRAPEFQFNVAGEYVAPLGGGFQGRVRADYHWQDRVFFTFFNHELNSQASYGLLNLSASIQNPDGSWRVTAFGRNVLDERYVTSANAFLAPTPASEKQRLGSIGAPRTYGITLAHNF